MRLYSSGGFTDYNQIDFLIFSALNNLKMEVGTIQSLKILDRKFLSNKGNTLDGIILSENKVYAIGLNIGGNPIGPGYQNYIPFLEEMGCKKRFGLFQPESLVGLPLVYFTTGTLVRGYTTPKHLKEI